MHQRVQMPPEPPVFPPQLGLAVPVFLVTSLCDEPQA